MLMMGPIEGILFAIFNGLLGVSLLSISLVGPATRRIEYLERFVLFAAAVTLLLPIPGSTPVGLLLGLLVLVRANLGVLLFPFLLAFYFKTSVSF